MTTSSAPATASLGVANRGARARGSLPRTESRGWTPAIVCVLAYLFVIHSGKLDIGSVAIVAGLLFMLLEGKPIRVPPFLTAFALFLGWTLLTAPFALNPSASFDRWWIYAKTWLISFLTYNVVRTPYQWRIITIGWLVIFALFPLRGIVFNVLTGNATQGRYSWNFAFRNPNDYAAIALLVLTLAIVHLRTTQPRWIRIGAWCGAVGLPVAILLTGSRAGLLGMLVLAAVLLAFSKRRLGILALAALAFAVALPFLPESTKNRLTGIRYLTSSETLAQADQYGSAAERGVILKVAKAVAEDHMAYGVGVGNYPLANASYAASRTEWSAARGFRDSHNAYLTLAAETGVLGLVLFGSSVFLAAVALVRTRQVEMRAAANTSTPSAGFIPVVLLGGLLGYATMSITGTYINYAFPYLFVALAVGYRPAETSRLRVAITWAKV